MVAFDSIMRKLLSRLSKNSFVRKILRDWTPRRISHLKVDWFNFCFISFLEFSESSGILFVITWYHLADKFGKSFGCGRGGEPEPITN